MEVDCETVSVCAIYQNDKRAEETWVAWRQLPSKQTEEQKECSNVLKS